MRGTFWGATTVALLAFATCNADILASETDVDGRDRVLNDKELVLIYRAAQKAGYPFGQIIRQPTAEQQSPNRG
jgi:hypothetical protein